ncbi:glycosyltransferase family 4 protein [uncultured Bilophila sp.]|uniref:glycosyltransferase family 4 protein n=2 Tax=uncultured Bilophila sp. TaxID=529385 RepID=UPI0025DD2EE5|nr:glycosyltransferase family 4 protein [uncultured Bilophila sp.]
MSSFRTIQVVNVRWFNATAWYGVELARLLNAAGHESRVVALEGTDTFRKAQELGLEPLALPLNAKNPLAFPGLIRDMRRLVKDFRPDVVNCHRGESFLFWGALKEAGGYALVRTRGDQRLPKGNWPNRMLHTKVADAVIATNSVMARYVAGPMGVPPQRLHTILGGVDTRRFRFDPEGRAAVRARYGFADGDCVVGLLGRFDLVKGQKETIEAIRRLVAEGLPVRLLLIGFSTATLQEEVEAWIREAGMEKHVTITGRVGDVAACLSALDVGVIASLWSETIARAALEIMACGRPLVSTSVGVMPDLLPAEALAAPGDVDALTALLRRAVVDAAWRGDLARTCSERIATLRDEDFLQQTLAVYAEACRRRRSSL